MESQDSVRKVPTEYLQKLDRSTTDTLQRNIVKLEKYSSGELTDILEDRVALAFKENTMADEALQLVADVGGQSGDARYSIELLWRAGKYADAENAKRNHVLRHIRKGGAR